MLNAKQGNQWTLIFIVFDLTRTGIEPESIASVADASSTQPFDNKTLQLGQNVAPYKKPYYSTKTFFKKYFCKIFNTWNMSSFLLKTGTLVLHSCDKALCEARSLNHP